MAVKRPRAGEDSDPVPATGGDGEPGSMLDTVDALNLDELFALYSQKIRERDVLDQSLGITRRAQTLLHETLGFIAANDNEAPIVVEVRKIEQEIVRHLAKQPEDLYQLRPRYFEELVCALLADMGLDVHLTPPSRDGGRDILAISRTPYGELLTIVECKRYAPENKITLDQIRSFLFTVRESDRASCGLFATTSFFSREASRLAADYAYQLKLKDFTHLKAWLANYGKWSEVASGGIWLPTDSPTSAAN